jgi:hypothetical protein
MVALGKALRRAAVIVIALLLASLLGLYWTQTRSAGTGASSRDLSSVNSLGSDEGDGKDENEGKKVTICHRTASDTNPYVRIRVSQRAVEAHRRHPPKHGRRDIIPAPSSGCPGAYGSG